MEPSSEAYAKYQAIAHDIDYKLAQINHDTAIHSSPTKKLEHPDFKALLEMGDVIVPYLFHSMIAHGASWTILMLLRRLVPETVTKPEHAGNFYGLIHDWLGWYLTSTYRENDDIYFGLVNNDAVVDTTG